MKVVQIRTPGGPEMLEYVELPDNPVPAGYVAVRAAAIGVGRPDVLIRTGRYKWMPSLPAVLGNELTGWVEALGDGVDISLLNQPVLVSARELAFANRDWPGITGTPPLARAMIFSA